MPDEPAAAKPPVKTPSAALAWSEARVDETAAAGRTNGTDSHIRVPPKIALWIPEGTTVALGISQKPDIELDTTALRRDGAGLVRRQSGGGAVLLYPGTLCWEAWANEDAIGRLTEDGGAGIRQSYAALSLPVVRALGRMGIPAFHAGICDVSAQAEGWPHPRKLAGTAQLRRKKCVLVHGSLLVNPDLDILSRYLRFPSAQPDYRQGRAHREFCTSVAEFPGVTCDGGGDVTVEAVSRVIRDEASALGWDALPIPAELDSAASALARDKYCTEAWNWDRIRAGVRGGQSITETIR